MRLPALALAALLALPVAADAAPRPQLTDPVGDLLPVMSPGYDVVSALFTNTSDTLVVTVTYAGAVPADRLASQVVVVDAAGCDEIYLQRWVNGARGYSTCVEQFDVTAEAKGRTVTFKLRFRQLPGHLRRGTVLTGLRTYTAVTEPAFGNESGEHLDAFGAGPVDSTRGEATYRIR